jgi:hypothetical protein
MTLDNQIVATASEYFAKVNSCDIDSIPVDWNETKIKTYETQYGKFQDFNQENIW